MDKQAWRSRPGLRYANRLRRPALTGTGWKKPSNLVQGWGAVQSLRMPFIMRPHLTGLELKRAHVAAPRRSRIVRKRHGRGYSSDAFIPHLGGPRGSGRLLHLRELIVKFAVAHRSHQNLDD